MRYAAPRYLTARNAEADRARTAERPKAAAITWAMPPKAVPKDEANPAERPPRRLRARTYSMPGPGERARSTAADRKIRNWLALNMTVVLRSSLVRKLIFPRRETRESRQIDAWDARKHPTIVNRSTQVSLNGYHTRPYGQGIVFVIVHRRPGSNFRRYFLKIEREHAGLLEFQFIWTANFGPPTRDHMIGDEVQCPQSLFKIVHEPCSSENDHG